MKYRLWGAKLLVAFLAFAMVLVGTPAHLIRVQGDEVKLPYAYVLKDGDKLNVIPYEDLEESYVEYTFNKNSDDAALARYYLNLLMSADDIEDVLIAYVSSVSYQHVDYAVLTEKYMFVFNYSPQQTYAWLNSWTADAGRIASQYVEAVELVGGVPSLIRGYWLDENGYEVVPQQSSEKGVESITVLGVAASVDSDDNTLYHVTLPTSATVTRDDFIITLVDSKAEWADLLPDSTDDTIWTFRVIAEDGSDALYTVQITFEDPPIQSDDTSIDGVQVQGVDAAVDASDPTIYHAELPYGTDLAALVPSDIAVFLPTGSNASVEEAVSTDGGETWTFVVTAEDGSTQETYTVHVTVALATLNIEGLSHDGVNRTITYTFNDIMVLLDQETKVELWAPFDASLFQIYAVTGDDYTYGLETESKAKVVAALWSDSAYTLTLTYDRPLEKAGRYLVDTWGYSIISVDGVRIDEAANIEKAIFEVEALALAKAVEHDASVQEIVYSFNGEPMLVHQTSRLVTRVNDFELGQFKIYQYVDGDYNETGMASYAVTGLVWDQGAETLTFSYEGQLPAGSYLIDAWGYDIMSLSGGRLVRSEDAIFTLYILTYTAGPGGTISGLSPQTVDYGRDGSTVTAEPDFGYHFVKWSDDLLTPSRTDRDVRADISVSAEFAVNHYTVTFSANAPDAIGSMDDQSFAYGQTQGLTPNAFTRAGYRFEGWMLSAHGLAVDYLDEASVLNLTSTHEGTVTLYAKWSVNTYTVAFDANGGEGSMADQSYTYDIGKALNANTFTRTGYQFAGWNTKADGTGDSYSDKEIVMNLTSEHEGLVTLYAQWAGNSYTVVFNANGGSGTMVDQSFIYDQAQALTPNGFTRTGYRFEGWMLSAHGLAVDHLDEAIVSNLTDTHGGSVTLYAKWVVNTYTVAFDANGGEGSMADQSYTYDIGKALSANTFTKGGYQFAGWNTKADGTGDSYSDKEVVMNLTSDHEGLVTLYAQWAGNSYTVVFNANGGSGTMADQSFIYDQAQALTLNGFTRTGYRFEGWMLSAHGLAVDHLDEASVSNLTDTHEGTVTLYAKWSVNTYTVVFDANGGQGTMADQPYTYDLGKALNANTFTKANYQFEGWNTKADGTGDSYSDKEIVMNLTSDHEGLVTLYAQWAGNSYTIVFNANGGSGTMADQSFIYDQAQALTPNGFTRTGYRFEGWMLSAHGLAVDYLDEASVSNLTDTHEGTVTLYAKWAVNTYTVAFDANGGVGTMADQPYTYDLGKALNANTFTKANYQFAGWNTKADGTGDSYSDKEIVMNLTSEHEGLVTLYAQWAGNAYTVVFNANGGSGSMADQSFIYDQAQALTPNGFTRTGYRFEGWMLSAHGLAVDYLDEASVLNLTSTHEGTVTLYAKWSVNTYTVAFDANGGEGTMADQSYTYDLGKALNANTFTRTGYRFEGWMLSAHGLAVDYVDKAIALNLTATHGATVTLYAKWAVNTYTVVFDANGGVGTMANQSYTYDLGKALSANNFTQGGYQFTGWNTKADGTGDSYSDKEVVTNLTSEHEGLVTLYAQWAENTYTVVFNANGGSGTMADQSFIYNQTQALNTNTFTRTGYRFEGWMLSVHGLAVDYVDEAIVSNLSASHGATVTLYAKWAVNTYTVAFDANGGQGTMASQSYTYDLGKVLNANTFTRTGYRFEGWMLSAHGLAVDYLDEAIVLNLTATHGATVTLYAKWAVNTYTVAFDANGGVGTMANQSYAYDIGKALSTNIFTRAGYQFAGWNTKADGTGDSYSDTEVVTKLTSEHGGLVTLYAQWAGNTYWVTFDANSGLGTMADQSFVYGQTQALTPNSFTKTGYRFEGWMLSVHGLAVDYLDEASVSNLSATHGATVTLYAKWAVNTYTVAFDANGGEGTMASQSYAYDLGKVLNANTFTRTGYRFEGWMLSAHGLAVDYLDEAIVLNLTATHGATVTLYAKWAVNTYTVAFDANGGEGSMADQSYAYDIGKALNANTFTQTGYQFAAWNTKADGTGDSYSDKEVVTNLTSEHEGLVTLYAQWTGNTYAVVFHANGGGGTMADQTLVYNQAQVLNANTFTRTGYRFEGWMLSAQGLAVDYLDEASVLNLSATHGATVTLYAKWAVNTYTVTFDANGGEGSMANQSYTYDIGKALSTNIFTRAGYQFAGWNTKADGTGQPYSDKEVVTNLTPEHEGLVTLYAQWAGNTYTVAFSANGGEGSMADQSHTYGQEKALEANTFTKTGYQFAGWNTEADGTGQLYSDEEAVMNLTSDHEGLVTLYAQWTGNTYWVIFSANSGVGTMADQSFVYGQPQALSPNGFTRTGYRFEGWMLSTQGLAVDYLDGASVSNLTTTHGGAVTLYAKWAVNTYAVAFDANGGEGSMADQSYTYDLGKALNANTFTKTGYQFAGWNTKANGTGDSYSDKEVVINLTSEHEGRVTLYAQWAGNSYTVVFDSNGGSGTMADQPHTYGLQKALSTNSYTKTGYEFAGWATTPTGPVVYANGAVVLNLTATHGGSVTLYAKWGANTFYVAFNANSGSGMMSEQSFIYDQAQALKSNTFSRTGHQFAGWATTPTGDVVYTNGMTVSNLTAINGETVTLYAKWTINTYQVTFVTNGGTAIAPVIVNHGDALVRPDDPFLMNYFVEGWYRNAGLTQAYNFSSPVTGPLTLYAKWAARKLTLTVAGTDTVIVTSNYGEVISQARYTDFQDIERGNWGWLGGPLSALEIRFTAPEVFPEELERIRFTTHPDNQSVVMSGEKKNIIGTFSLLTITVEIRDRVHTGVTASFTFDIYADFYHAGGTYNMVVENIIIIS